MQINILQQGAVGDDTTLNTAAIQSAIDAVAQAGGGQVRVPPGVFLTGMIALKDRVRLHLDAGAVLKASPRVEDHPKRELKHGMDWNGGWARANRFHLLVADGCRDIAITGQGTLDGNGTAWYPATTDPLTWPLAYEDARRMAPMVEIFDCRDVRIEGVTLTNVGFWTLHLHESDRVWVRGPLATGEQWSQRVRDRDGDPAPYAPITRFTSVGRYERIATPAGTFDAIGMHVIMQLDDETFWRYPTQCDYVVWYAPAVGAAVREERRSEWRDKGGQDSFAYHPDQNEVIELVA